MTKIELRTKIENVLSRKDQVGMHAVGRALVHLNNRQTDEEQAHGATHNLNGMGFQPSHAHIGTSMAQFYAKRGFLSPKQVAYWQNEENKLRKPRISRYWRQLVEEAEAKMSSSKPEEEEIVEGMDDDQLARLGVAS